jgi:hypothetical protein
MVISGSRILSISAGFIHKLFYIPTYVYDALSPLRDPYRLQ